MQKNIDTADIHFYCIKNFIIKKLLNQGFFGALRFYFCVPLFFISAVSMQNNIDTADIAK
jgi:hypothetical protein